MRKIKKKNINAGRTAYLFVDLFALSQSLCFFAHRQSLTEARITPWLVNDGTLERLFHGRVLRALQKILDGGGIADRRRRKRTPERSYRGRV